MPFKIKIVEVNIEEVRNGKNKYDKATVVYAFNGQNRTQNIMSFSNPAIFAKVRGMKSGEEYNVEVTKNDKGYNQWASIEPATSGGSAASEPASPGRKTVSTYETAQERALRQLYIIRQSSLSNAITFLENNRNQNGYGIPEVIETADRFVDYVFQQPSKELGDETSSLLDMENDLPS